MKKGDMIGVNDILINRLRKFTSRAAESCKFLSIDRESF